MISDASVAVVAALGGSLIFGVSSVGEQRGTQRVKRRAALSPRLLLEAGDSSQGSAARLRHRG